MRGYKKTVKWVYEYSLKFHRFALISVYFGKNLFSFGGQVNYSELYLLSPILTTDLLQISLMIYVIDTINSALTIKIIPLVNGCEYYDDDKNDS